MAESHEKINSTAIQNFNKVRLLWRCANLKYNIMNSINLILENLANELNELLLIQNYRDYGSLKFASKSLFQYGFENDVLLMNKEIIDEHYQETFFIVGSKFVFPLNLIGLDYQEK